MFIIFIKSIINKDFKLIMMNSTNTGNTNILSPKKHYKDLNLENKKINKILKKFLKHIKYLDKEIAFFSKFEKKNSNLDERLDLLISNFKETLLELKKERDMMEQKHLDNKILIDKLKDKIKGEE